MEAIREAVLNALIHRDYSIYTEGTPIQIDFFSDWLEIHSPGSLYGRMTVEQLGVARPDLRNPALAVMTEVLTGAENRYSGIPTIRRAMELYGLPAPKFENRRNEFVVTLYIVGLIRSYIEELHRTGRYDALADQVLQFKLSVQVFDPFGKALQENYFNDFTLMSETDLDRQVRNADARLGRYGFPNIYGSRYFDEENPNAHKIDCVLFAADESCRAKLGEYAKNKLREFSGKYREIMADRIPLRRQVRTPFGAGSSVEYCI